MNVYSVIVTFNGSKWIKNCLDSLVNNNIVSKILVIDNNSADNTVQLIESNYPEVEIIQTGTNLGFGKANNIGLKIASDHKADYILLLNQDSWLDNDCLSTMISHCESDKSVGIIAPINLTADGGTIEKSCENELNPMNCPSLISDLYLKKVKALYYLTNYINASCWLITSKCLQKTGGFDPIFSHYGEDINYCMRVRYLGFNVALTSLSNSYHAKDNYVPDIKEAKKQLIRLRTNYLNSYLLNKLTDVNLNYSQTLTEEILMLLGLLLKNLTKLRISLLQVYFGILIFVLLNISKIRKARARYVAGGCPYLK